MPDTGDSAERSTRAELVRLLNSGIRELAGRLPDQDPYLLDFYCECGCWQTVQLTAAEYDALEGAPVYQAGHGEASH